MAHKKYTEHPLSPKELRDTLIERLESGDARGIDLKRSRDFRLYHIRNREEKWTGIKVEQISGEEISKREREALDELFAEYHLFCNETVKNVRYLSFVKYFWEAPEEGAKDYTFGQDYSRRGDIEAYQRNMTDEEIKGKKPKSSDNKRGSRKPRD